ncbi:hypothetical protein [Verminephrobacter eiseniae]|uniref:hypothetical protein n=1 Tax=Verminephrobacter eiseniae TaxID=364317 RepID=UPI0022387147|nr:hypothetical protein [Verminephrobacter eiseniae]
MYFSPGVSGQSSGRAAFIVHAGQLAHMVRVAQVVHAFRQRAIVPPAVMHQRAGELRRPSRPDTTPHGFFSFSGFPDVGKPGLVANLSSLYTEKVTHQSHA